MENEKAPRVAIIGLGLSGLAALKNFLELGFDVIGFERHDYIGGLWQWTDDPNQTSVLKSTRSNTSKQFACYQDFPFKDDAPDYPSAAEYEVYLSDYAAQFRLEKHWRLGVTINKIERSKDGTQWIVRAFKDGHSSTYLFNKVLIATGPYNHVHIPSIPGRDRFIGKVMHARAYKSPSVYTGNKVVVVGMSNTGCDIALELACVADKVYLSHRTGVRIVKRYSDNKPMDHGLTRRLTDIMRIIGRLFPKLKGIALEYALESRMKKMFPYIDPAWRLLPAPPDSNSTAVFNDLIIDALASGSVTSISGIKAFTETGIETDKDGQIELDVVIFATGYHFDYSILDPEADPTKSSTPEWDSSPHNNGLPYPRLFQTLFSPKYPESLAFIGPCQGYTFAALCHADLASQAIAQVWLGRFPLPSQTSIQNWCEKDYQYSLRQINRWRIFKTGTENGAFESWLSRAAGNELEEYLGWGWKAWRFWWKERQLYMLIMDGVNTPFVYRLFEGRKGSRKKWDGAREAIYRANGKTLKVE